MAAEIVVDRIEDESVAVVRRKKALLPADELIDCNGCEAQTADDCCSHQMTPFHHRTVDNRRIVPFHCRMNRNRRSYPSDQSHPSVTHPNRMVDNRRMADAVGAFLADVEIVVQIQCLTEVVDDSAASYEDEMH